MESILIIGVQDELQVFEDKLIITPKGILGFLNKGFKGSKEIPFSSISAIQLKEASMFLNGYIQFTIIGGNESRKGIMSAQSDENSFFFTQKNNEEIKKVKTFIQERMGNKKSSFVNDSLADEILKLKGLKDQGLISEDEFEKIKQNLISKAA
jgi:hypothetical protein